MIVRIRIVYEFMPKFAYTTVLLEIYMNHLINSNIKFVLSNLKPSAYRYYSFTLPFYTTLMIVYNIGTSSR